MKTLDEVIKVFTKCFDNTYNIVPLECEPEYGEDALHYLKMLREMTCGTSQILRNTSQITCPKCHSEFVILPEANNPLTWDELRTMEGKPVWVETDDNGKFWTIVDNFRTICNQECLCCSKGYMCRSTHARGDWQAYRKEKS